ncbi:MAG: hypothetical protein ACRDR6_25745 [Pseudonocardiaceae bacterium]
MRGGGAAFAEGLGQGVRWVQRFTPVLIDAARSCRRCPGDRWFADEA